MKPFDNPLAMLIGGFAVGYLTGCLVPVSRFESDRLRPVVEDVKDRVRDAGAQAVRRGGEVIKETISGRP